MENIRYGDKAISAVSFSFNAREELTRNLPERRCCRESMLASILFSIGSFIEDDSEKLHVLTTSLPGGARLIYKLGKEIVGDRIRWGKKREVFLSKRIVYNILIPETESMKEYVLRWGISGKLQRKNLRRACCRRAFLVGAFMSVGSVNAPESGYHFEIIQKDSEVAQVLLQILARVEVNCRITRRRNRHVVYVKKADEIANLLNVMGSHRSLLKYEEVRAIKETKNEVRRRVNAETSNMDKTAKSSARQIMLIRMLKEKGVLKSLSPILQQTAELRLSFPEASLKELGEHFNPHLPKSSVNSRLRRLEKIARRDEKVKYKAKQLKEV